MALSPRFAAQKFSATSTPTPTLHTLELFLDYVCPFSAKMFNTVYNEVFPLIKEKYGDKVQVLFRQQVQPWHPSSTLVHEAAVGVVQLGGGFWEFSDLLFKDAKSYYDVNVVNETRNQTYARLAKLGAKAGVDEQALLKLLLVSDKPGEDGSLNTGNGVTNDLKVLIKMNRLVGVHVSPTVIFDGVVENSISSSFSGAQWAEWLQSRVA